MPSLRRHRRPPPLRPFAPRLPDTADAANSRPATLAASSVASSAGGDHGQLPVHKLPQCVRHVQAQLLGWYSPKGPEAANRQLAFVRNSGFPSVRRCRIRARPTGTFLASKRDDRYSSTPYSSRKWRRCSSHSPRVLQLLNGREQRVFPRVLASLGRQVPMTSRRAALAMGQACDQVQGRIVGPMQIFQDQQHRFGRWSGSRRTRPFPEAFGSRVAPGYGPLQAFEPVAVSIARASEWANVGARRGRESRPDPLRGVPRHMRLSASRTGMYASPVPRLSRH